MQFDLINGGLGSPRCAVPVAVALLQGLNDVTNSRLVQQGQQTKMEQVYHYLTGTKFRGHVDRLSRKVHRHARGPRSGTKVHWRQWAKREPQILSIIDSTVGMVGDLRAIAG
ncbi:hypothetical protein J2R76_003784 [Bradyrhizobium sp. USDA 4532]|uniref:DUF2130 domain-containing protein n=1 Tax=unclassified Bradyrhizobium TaxID=2631580 RepID=UPI00209ED0C1|nr:MULTISPECIES: DUF2130 domain-containing protein [unclassified Bradyrhizobium]MCP1835447.1 hypothetical protein [Bradyrhizobium sp. USDA 4545]MCP1920193.1 hypothetical protein [Bradyrhizobium sp. USDA 4532]